MIDVDDINEVPEKYRDQYAEVKEGEKTIWRNKGFITVKEVAEKYKGRAAELDNLQRDLSEKHTKAEADRIQALKEKGDFEELYKVESTKNAEILERLRKKDEALSNKAKQSFINGVSDIFTDAGRETARRLLGGMVGFDVESEKYTFVDDAGSSLSVDEKGFKAYVENSPLFAPLVVAKSSVGGKGSNSLGGTGGEVKTNLGGSKSERTAAIAKRFNL
jgi:hypothetical protein